MRSVEFDVVDRPDTLERTEDTDGANDLDRPAGGVTLNEVPVLSTDGKMIFFRMIAGDSPTDGRGDFVRIAGEGG